MNQRSNVWVSSALPMVIVSLNMNLSVDKYWLNMHLADWVRDVPLPNTKLRRTFFIRLFKRNFILQFQWVLVVALWVSDLTCVSRRDGAHQDDQGSLSFYAFIPFVLSNICYESESWHRKYLTFCRYLAEMVYIGTINEAQLGVNAVFRHGDKCVGVPQCEAHSSFSKHAWCCMGMWRYESRCRSCNMPLCANFYLRLQQSIWLTRNRTGELSKRTTLSCWPTYSLS